jgi:murein DD-endopeptidase MepM/ murein hydrolase activator NlpD
MTWTVVAVARVSVLVLVAGGGAVLATGDSPPTANQAAASRRVNSSAAVEPGPRAQAGAFDWPVAKPVQVVREFDLPAEPWLAGHRGVDLFAPNGSTVLAPAAGTVSFNGWIVDRDVLVIKHGELASTLEPVQSDLAVGDAVGQGSAVGTVAAGQAQHCPDCLHWGVRRGEQYLDPTLLVNPRPRAVLWR